MKTARPSLPAILCTALLFTSAAAALADAPATLSGNSRTMERAVLHQINRHVIFPLDAEEGAMCGVVDVSYAVDVDGHLVVKEARSDNQALRDYVVGKLGKVQVGVNPSGLWNTTHVRFTFKPEQQEL